MCINWQQKIVQQETADAMTKAAFNWKYIIEQMVAIYVQQGRGTVVLKELAPLGEDHIYPCKQCVCPLPCGMLGALLVPIVG